MHAGLWAIVPLLAVRRKVVDGRHVGCDILAGWKRLGIPHMTLPATSAPSATRGSCSLPRPSGPGCARPFPPAPAGRWLTCYGTPPMCTGGRPRSEEHTSELQSRRDLVCRLLLEKKKNN